MSIVLSRVRSEDSFFGAVVEVPVEEHEFIRDSKYCKCQMRGATPDIVCNYHYDVHNCQAVMETRRGRERTDDIKIKSTGDSKSNFFQSTTIVDDFSQSDPLAHRRRTRRSIQDAVPEQPDMDWDYFDYEFVYDEKFVGQVSWIWQVVTFIYSDINP